MSTAKTFFSATLVVAYLALGSGNHITKATKNDPRNEAADFASTLPRKVFRYSVVPGGVYTPQELAIARRNDPIVAAHYADFGTNTHVTTLKEDMYVYISYRKGGQIYYSKKKHKVCKGEMVITDGKNYARTRCANRLSKVFRAPTMAFAEPKAPEFDYIDPPPPPDTYYPNEPLLTSNYYSLPGNPGAPPPQATTGANPGPGVPYTPFTSQVILPNNGPFAAVGPGGAPISRTPITTTTPPPVTPVPEPAEWPFALASVAGLLFFLRSRKR